MVARLQTLALLGGLVLAGCPYLDDHNTFYAVANMLGHSVMVARQQETNLLEPAAGGFPALPAFDLCMVMKQHQ